LRWAGLFSVMVAIRSSRSTSKSTRSSAMVIVCPSVFGV
jgi:hypothetical protein